MSEPTSHTGGTRRPSPARLLGHEYEVTLHYTVEYSMTVFAGPERNNAVEEADLHRFAADVDPSDRDLVHSEVEATRDIFEDDPEAHKVADWIDAPSAPSEDTYWDDTQHFDSEGDNAA